LSLILQNLLQQFTQAEILADFEKYDGKKLLFLAAGRLMGKCISFIAELKDAEGRIQYIS
jgi:hypothetical protein